MTWTPAAAEHAEAEAVRHDFDFVEIALLTPGTVDAAHTQSLLDREGMPGVCSLGLLQEDWPSPDPESMPVFIC